MTDATDTEGHPDNPTKWNYVTAWLKAEPFWQGVAASTLSTGVMAIAGLFAALMTGWVDWKAAIVALLSFVLVVSVAWLIIFLKPTFKEMAVRWRKRDREASFASVSVLSALAGLSGAILALVKLFGW